MGIFRLLKHLLNLEKLYHADLEKQASRDKLLAKGITEDWVKELVRQADTGVVAELSFPSGIILRVTRTLRGMETESLGQNGAGIRFKEEF